MRHFSLLAAAALIAGSASAHAATYSFTTIDNPADPPSTSCSASTTPVSSAAISAAAPRAIPTRATPSPPRTPRSRRPTLPGSAQTQATGISSTGNITGFWSDTNTGSDANFGFIRWNLHGHFVFIDVNDPNVASTPSVTQVLGMNKAGIAAGFYNDADGPRTASATTCRPTSTRR